jgi:hypothetical protein
MNRNSQCSGKDVGPGLLGGPDLPLRLADNVGKGENQPASPLQAFGKKTPVPAEAAWQGTTGDSKFLSNAPHTRKNR